MLHADKMCSDIKKVSSGGKAETENLKVCYIFIIKFLALLPEVTVGMPLHFLHLWTVGQKHA